LLAEKMSTAVFTVPSYRELEDPRSAVQFEKRAVSWFGNKDGVIGQDESVLRYLHLPEKLDGVNLNLNRSHPEDDFSLEKYESKEDKKAIDMMSWIKDFGLRDNM